MISLRFPQQKNLFDFIKLIIVFLFSIDYYININFKELNFMVIIIRDKDTGERKGFGELFELFTDTFNINFTIACKDGWKRDYSLSKMDYEIAYIG